MKRMTKMVVALAVAAGAFLLLWDFTPSASMKSATKGQAESKAPEAAPRTGYRSPSDRHKVSISDPELARTIQAQGGRIVANYGSYQLLEVGSAAASELANNNAAEVVDENNLVLLNAGAIDTSTTAVQTARHAVGGFTGQRLHLVQFAGPIRPEWYNALERTGARVVTYIPNNAYLIYGSAKQVQSAQLLAANAGVAQWDGDYTAAYRIDPAITANVGGKEAAETKAKTPVALNLSAKGHEQFTLQLVADAAANAATLALINQYKLEPIIKQDAMLGYVNVTVALPKDAVVNVLAQRDDVVSIQQWLTPVKLDERQDIIISGNLTGTPAVPVPGDYLAYLAGKGFTFNTPTTFAVNISDSGVDNATTTPNHFGLYTLGNASSPANSRIIYNRLEGTPNAGSTLQGCDGHGNLNTHIIGGYVPTGTVGGVNFAAAPHADASGYRWGLGVLPNVRVGSSVIFDPGTFTAPTYQNLESKAYRDGARVSSNSWGSTANTYTTDSQQYDALVRDAQPDTGCTAPNCISTPGNQEYVIVFAAGNSGSGANTVGSPSTGKNVITVGAAENVSPFSGADGCGINDTGADSANDMISFSSRGPTSDGRKKPDIVAPGTHVSGGVAQASLVLPSGSGTGAQLACFDGSGVCGGVGSNFFPAGQQYYTASSGTSHSTPATAGVAALIRQYFINQALTPPSPAMTKALIMNTARYMSGVGANDNLPSNSQGHGEISLNNFFDAFTTPTIRRDQLAADKFTASGQQRILTGTISNSAKPFRVTLAWTEPPGPTSGNAFVNNLDLEVTVGGNTYKGNVFSGANSATGGTADTRDNVESVFVPAGVTGNFIVKVTGTNIAGNGVPGDADALDQDYALIAYNGTPATIPVLSAGTAALTAESCAPANMAADPNESVTFNLPLANIGTADTTNLVATLQATGGVTSPSSPQTYGALVANGASVTKAFSFTVDPSAACGSPLTLTLQLQDGATNLGTVTYTLRVGGLGIASTAMYTTGNINVPIPDVASVDVPIVVGASGAVSDINVKLRANHTFDGDLVVDLIAPDNTTVRLISSRGGSGDNFGSGSNDCAGTPTILDDAAATAIGAGTAPFAGTFRPDGLLSDFNGHLLNGTWTLRVTDTAAQDTGTVFCVTLEITRQPFVCCGVAGSPAIASGGIATIAAESVTPTNNAPDPGETVTAMFPVINTGDGPSANLVGTMQTSGGITPTTPTATYGVINAGAAAVARPFTFVANGACGSTVTASVQFQDGATNLGTVTYTFRLGTIATTSQTFSNPTPIIIPASGTGATTGAPAAPYPSGIVVAGYTSPVTGVTVTLKQISHTFPADVDVLLVGPTGAKFIVMSDVIGGTDWTGQTYTLDDTAAALLPASGAPPASGSFKPTNYGATTDAFPTPAPAAPYLSPGTAGTETFASAFGGLDPNGAWSLYVVDDASTDSGMFAGGWDLTLVTSSNVCNTQACGLTCPANINVPATGPSGAVVTYPNATVAGTCGVPSYSVPSGSTFPLGTTNVTVSGAGGATCSFSVTVAGPAASTTLALSEFRERGPQGAFDEYVEVGNLTNTPFTVNASDASAGWSVAALNAAGTAVAIVGTIPNGTVIPARGHYLLANNTATVGYSLGAYATPDTTFTADIPDNTAIALFNSASSANLNSGTLVDAVGFVGQTGALPTLFGEGTRLPTIGTTNGEYAFVRKLTTGIALDSGNNVGDFDFVATDGNTYGGTQSILGAPGPESLASPTQRNATLKAGLIDPTQASTAPPNRIRDNTPGTGTTAFGTLDIRRKFTNTTGAAVNALRFRIVDTTTLNSPNPGGAQADLRYLTSGNTTANGGAITITGTTLQAPASSSTGGGLNASGVVVLPGGQLNNGATINVRFVLGVAANGRFRFFINVEGANVPGPISDPGDKTPGGKGDGRH